MATELPHGTSLAEDKASLLIKHRIFEPLAGILILMFSLVWNLTIFMVLADLYSKSSMDWKLLPLLVIFIPVGLISFYIALAAFAGRDEIRLEDQRLSAYSGILMLGFSRRLDLIDIESFYVDPKKASSILFAKMKDGRKRKILAASSDLTSLCLRKLQEHQQNHGKRYYYTRMLSILKRMEIKKAAVSGSLSESL